MASLALTCAHVEVDEKQRCVERDSVRASSTLFVIFNYYTGYS